ncbi:MAG TPA: hypothetical protein DC001_01190 [Clostridiales bacterium]|nr:hypothetical protein [Clostridiales bacterium]HBR08092.1 hypothetical protein [Clostridiales bacterium]
MGQFSNWDREAVLIYCEDYRVTGMGRQAKQTSIRVIADGCLFCGSRASLYLTHTGNRMPAVLYIV